MHFLHSSYKTLLYFNKIHYFHRMRLFFLLSIVFCSISASASCENEALLNVGINPDSVSKEVSACIPVSETRCEMTIKVRGNTIGSMTVACENGQPVETITPYTEIGQY